MDICNSCLNASLSQLKNHFCKLNFKNCFRLLSLLLSLYIQRNNLIYHISFYWNNLIKNRKNTVSIKLYPLRLWQLRYWGGGAKWWCVQLSSCGKLRRLQVSCRSADNKMGECEKTKLWSTSNIPVLRMNHIISPTGISQWKWSTQNDDARRRWVNLFHHTSLSSYLLRCVTLDHAFIFHEHAHR